MSIAKKELIPLYLVLGGILVLTPAVSSLASAVPYSGHFQSYKGGTFGTIASIQGGGDTTHPTWILSGHWTTNLVNKTKGDFNQTNPAKFDAIIYHGAVKWVCKT